MKKSSFLQNLPRCLAIIIWLYGGVSLSIDRPALNKTITLQTSNLGVLPWLPEASIDTQRVFSSGVFDALLKYNEQMQILPGIFTDFNWDEKNSEYRFKFDPKLKYHDGQKIHPADIEFAILKLFLTDKNIVRKEIFSNIVGVGKLRAGQKFRAGMVEGIRYDTNGNFYIKLEKANSRFLYSLANSVPGIGPRDSFNSDLFSYKDLPVGLGPYRVIKVDRKKVIITLERVEKSQCDHKNPCPHLIKMIESGEPTDNNADIAMFSSARPFLGNPQYKKIISSLPMSVLVIDFNFSNKIAENSDFRKALALTINREEICKNYVRLRPSHQLVTSRTIGRTNRKFAYDPKTAQDIINKKFSNTKIVGWFHGPPNFKNPDYIEAIRKQFASIGVDIQFSSTLKHSMNSANVALFVYSTSLDYSNPVLPLAMNFESNERKSHLPKNRRILEQLYSTLKTAQSPESEANAVKSVVNYYMDNKIQIPIAQGYKLMALKNGVEYSKTGSFAYSIDFDGIIVK